MSVGVDAGVVVDVEVDDGAVLRALGNQDYAHVRLSSSHVRVRRRLSASGHSRRFGYATPSLETNAIDLNQIAFGLSPVCADYLIM